MINEIELAINKKIKSVYPDIWIEPEDVKDGFKRPSFFIDFPYSKTKRISDEFYQKDLSVVIHYFPSNKNKYSMENTEISEEIEKLFLGKKLIVGDKHIPINSIEIDTVDGVLKVSFDLEVNTRIEEIDDNELMGELEVNMKEE